jgi:hypothetical protein
MQAIGPNQVKSKWRATVALLPHIDRWSTEHKQFPPRSLIRPSDRQTVRQIDRPTDRLSFFLSLPVNLPSLPLLLLLLLHERRFSDRTQWRPILPTSRRYSSMPGECSPPLFAPPPVQSHEADRIPTSQSRARSNNKCQSCSNLRYHRASMSPLHLITLEAS